MKTQTISLVVLCLLAGCVRNVIWDGYLPSRTYKITFFSVSGEPIEDVMFSCEAEYGTVGYFQAKQLNESAHNSNEDGLLLLIHTGLEIGGSYKEFGPFQWDRINPNQAFCKFFLKGKVIHEDYINTFNIPKTVVVNGNAT